MDIVSLVIISFGALLFSIVSGHLQGSMITGPMIFVGFGFLVGTGGFNVAPVDVSHGAIHLVAEITLVLVLFSDAARIDLSLLRKDHNLPVRMLVIGLPLSIGLGALFAALIFPQFALWEALLLAAILAPTDAALGQAVISHKDVPSRIRQTLNVESGLNDGIVLPIVLIAAMFAGTQMPSGGGWGEWLAFGVLQLTLGPVAGLVVGYVGAKLIDRAARAGRIMEAYEGIALIALAALSYTLAQAIGGNGFISAFVAGLVFGNTLKHTCTFLFEFMETEGHMLVLLTFLVFGAAMLPEALHLLDWHIVLYVIASLTVIRMVPIALSLIGTGVSGPTYAFLGWFGPRGLASFLFALLILEDSQAPHIKVILATTIITVAVSTLLHGLSAAPLARIYGAMVAAVFAKTGACEEMKSVTPIPMRDGELFHPQESDASTE